MKQKVTALVRPPGASFVHALSQNSAEAPPIDFPLALQQHRRYAQALKQAGASVISLEPLEKFPDSVFVEDTAIILEDRALICAMKEDTRRDEIECIMSEIKNYRPLEILQPPVSIDGGDILIADTVLFAGQSKRTNKEAVKTLAGCTDKQVVPVPVLHGLHLKTSATYLGKNIIILDPARIDPSAFKDFEVIKVEKEESYAANCLAIGDKALMASGFPALAERVRKRGFQVIEVPMSEFAKASGSITCLSLLF